MGGNAPRHRSPMHWGLSLLPAVLASSLVAADIAPEDPTACWLEPGAAATVILRSDPPLPSGPVMVTLSDWSGAAEPAPVAVVEDQGRIRVSLGALPRGFHSLRVAGSATVIGLAASPTHQGPADPFFAIDAAMSWIEPREELRRPLIGLMPRLGIAMARERLRWAEIQPDRDRTDWQTDRRYDGLREQYRAKQIPVLEMFHDAPAWAQPGADIPYPRDLVAVADGWTAIAKRWSPTWGGLEVWNETDWHFSNDQPADQYVPVVKAVAWAFRDAGITTPIGGGVLTHLANDGFREQLAANGLLDCVDFLSIHSYEPPEKLMGQVAAYRAWFAKHGHADMPLWLSEYGDNHAGEFERVPEQADLADGWRYAASTIHARALGITRAFPFLYVNYHENGATYGMNDASGTPQRCMASYATVIALLSGRKTIGRINVGADAHAYAFASPEADTAVIALVASPGHAPVALPFPVTHVDGIDGRPLELVGGAVPLGDGVAYAHVAHAALRPALLPGPEMLVLGSFPDRWGKRREPSPIILQHLAAQRAPSVAGHDRAAIRSAPLPLRVTNLGRAPVEATVQIEPGGPRRAVLIAAHTATDLMIDLTEVSTAGATTTVVVTIGDVVKDQLVIPLVDVKR